LSRLTSLALVAFLSAPAACARGPQSGSLSDDVAAEEDGESDVTFQVVSHNPRDVVIYLLLGSSRQRLGMASGNSTTVFTMKWGRLANASDIHLRGEQMGNGEVVQTDRLQLKPGGRVLWTLQAELNQSIDAVY
jgi:hypothetical protein